MATYTQPTGDGMQWEMDWDEYAKNGFDEKKAKKVKNPFQAKAIAKVKEAVKKRDKEAVEKQEKE
jgi:hypothetical protein